MKTFWFCGWLVALAWLCASSYVAAQVSSPPQEPPAGQNPAQNQTQPQGQNPAGQEQPPSPDRGAEPAMESDHAPVPMLVSGAVSSLAFSTELARSNYIRGGVAVSATYDDNVLSTTSNTIGDYSYSILPHIELDQSRARLHWLLDYAAGFVANQRLTDRNQSAHDLGGELEYRLSPHVSLRLLDHFTITTNFYDQLETLGAPSSGALQQPNQTVITPLARQIRNLGTAALNYQFSADDMVGASGTFFESRFRDAPAGTTGLLDTSAQEADGYFTHRLSPRYWLGVAYEYQHFSFQPGFEEAFTHSVFLFNTIYLQPRMTLTLFGGPEHTDLESQIVTPIVNPPVVFLVSVPASRREWTVGGGATFSWQGEKTSAQAGVVRKTSDGGGILGAVELTTVNGALRRRLAPSWTLAFGAIYGDDSALGGFTTVPDKLRSASGSVSMEHQLGRHFMLSYGYARDYQRESGSVPPPIDVNHNRAWASFSYNFERPFGK